MAGRADNRYSTGQIGTPGSAILRKVAVIAIRIAG